MCYSDALSIINDKKLLNSFIVRLNMLRNVCIALVYRTNLFAKNNISISPKIMTPLFHIIAESYG